MIKQLLNSLKRLVSAKEPARSTRQSPVPSAKKNGVKITPNGAAKTPPQKAATRSLRSNEMHSIESLGPGKNVLVKNRYVREDTGTHETLKILDESLLDTADESGIDPYNTGAFDRSKNWGSRNRK